MLSAATTVRAFRTTGPKPKAVYLDWDFLAADGRASSELAAVCILQRSQWDPDAAKILGSPIRWLEAVDTDDSIPIWRLNPRILERMETFGKLATELLPDFIEGSIVANSIPSSDWWRWVPPTICVDFRDPRNPDQSQALVEDYELAEMWDERPGHELLFGYGRGTLSC